MPRTRMVRPSVAGREGWNRGGLEVAEWVYKPGSVSRPTVRATLKARPEGPKVGTTIITLAPRVAAGVCAANPRLIRLGRGLGGSRRATTSPPIWPCSGWGLPCPRCFHRSGALLPSLARRLADSGSRSLGAPVRPYPPSSRQVGATAGGVFSVALSVGSPRLRVTKHPALWSPDFPPRSLGAIARPTPPNPFYPKSARL